MIRHSMKNMVFFSLLWFVCPASGCGTSGGDRDDADAQSDIQPDDFMVDDTAREDPGDPDAREENHEEEQIEDRVEEEEVLCLSDEDCPAYEVCLPAARRCGRPEGPPLKIHRIVHEVNAQDRNALEEYARMGFTGISLNYNPDPSGECCGLDPQPYELHEGCATFHGKACQLAKYVYAAKKEGLDAFLYGPYPWVHIRYAMDINNDNGPECSVPVCQLAFGDSEPDRSCTGSVTIYCGMVCPARYEAYCRSNDCDGDEWWGGEAPENDTMGARYARMAIKQMYEMINHYIRQQHPDEPEVQEWNIAGQINEEWDGFAKDPGMNEGWRTCSCPHHGDESFDWWVGKFQYDWNRAAWDAGYNMYLGRFVWPWGSSWCGIGNPYNESHPYDPRYLLAGSDMSQLEVYGWTYERIREVIENYWIPAAGDAVGIYGNSDREMGNRKKANFCLMWNPANPPEGEPDWSYLERIIKYMEDPDGDGSRDDGFGWSINPDSRSWDAMKDYLCRGMGTDIDGACP